MMGQEPRQTTSNIGHLEKPTLPALVHGLNRHYYSLSINYRKNEREDQMLLNLHKNKWNDALKLKSFASHESLTSSLVHSLKELGITYRRAIVDEIRKTPEQLLVDAAGRMDAKKRLDNDVQELTTENILMALGTMVDSLIF
eukprot:GHVT01020086.1.p1 GENE.GHVT01020086.1~~GHVT01020086.1.p1  ORF type:complete len:142 (-),score=20.53 GHVT01020086.1:404-829(-)